MTANAEPRCQAFASTAAHGQRDLMNKALRSRCASGVAAVNDTLERFAERFAWADGLATPEPTRLHVDHHAAAVGREILEGAPVTAVHLTGDDPAFRTGGIVSSSNSVDDEFVTIHGPPARNEPTWDQFLQARFVQHMVAPP